MFFAIDDHRLDQRVYVFKRARNILALRLLSGDNMIHELNVVFDRNFLYLS